MNKLKKLILDHINSIGCRPRTATDRHTIGKIEGIIEVMYMLDIIKESFTCDVLRRACRDITNNETLSSVQSATNTILDFCNMEND